MNLKMIHSGLYNKGIIEQVLIYIHHYVCISYSTLRIGLILHVIPATEAESYNTIYKML